MNSRILFFFVSIAVLISCAQNPVNINNGPEPLNIGDRVKRLGDNIMIVYQDQKNNYWFGSWKDGAYRYDGKTILHFTAKNGLPDNRIEEFKEDHFGNVYLNTSKGVCKFDGTKFTTLPIDHLNTQWKLEAEDLWFRQGWDSGFVYRYDGNFLYKLKCPKNSQYSNPYAVYSIYKDSKGNIWFGTNPLGVFRYNGKTIDWITENDVTELHNGPSNGVRSIIEDKEGYFWFNSLYRYNVYNKVNGPTFYTREKSIGSLDGKDDNGIVEYLSIAKDNKNELWIVTYTDGVWHYNGKTIEHYLVKNGTKEITLFSIYKDNNGDLWLGTHENGAYKFNGKSFERFGDF